MNLPLAATWTCPLMAIWPLRVVAWLGCWVPTNGTSGMIADRALSLA